MRLPAPVVNTARWLFALVVPGCALGLSLAMRPLIDQVPSPPFVAGVLVVAWVSGFKPALLSIVLSAQALNHYFMPPIGGWVLEPRELVWMALFLGTTVLTAWLVANRAQSRERVVRSAEHLRLVTDAAPVMIAYLDTELRYRFANRPYAERYGLTPVSIVGRRIADVLEPERYASTHERLAVALRGETVSFEGTGRGIEPGVRHLHATYVPDTVGGVVRGLVAVLTDITERKRGEDERVRMLTLEQARRREAEAVAELGRVLTQGLEVRSVAQRLVELARGVLRAAATTAYRLDPDSGDFVCLALSGDMGPFRPGGVVPRESGVIGAALRQGRTVWSADVLRDPQIRFDEETRAWIERASYRAVLAVPLRVKSRVIGAFAVGDVPGRVFTPEDVRLAEAFADHAAAALENARLYTEAQARRREAELMADLARAVNGSLDVDTVLQQVVAAAKEACGGDLARIALWDEAREGMVYRYTIGTRVPGQQQVLLQPGKGLAGEVMATGRPTRTADMLNDPRLHPDYVSMIRAEGSTAVVVAPITMRGRVEGLLYVENRRPRAFTERDESVLLRLADHAAIALRNAQVFLGEQAGRGEAEALARHSRLAADVSRALASSLDDEATLDTVAQLVVPGHADWCMVHMARRDGSVRLVAVAHADPAHSALAAETRALPPSTDWLERAGPMIHALRAGRSTFLPHVTPAELEAFAGGVDDRRIYAALHPHSLVMVPLVARGRTLGSMTWLRTGGAPAFDADDLALAEDLAARMALGIDNARLYRRAERARVEAEDANRAKDEFLAVLSHELRTPLTAMLGWLRLLRAGQLNADKTAQALEVVERNTRAQAQLINDLLDVSRIVAGKLQLDRYPVDLAPIMEEAVELSRGDAESKRVKIELTVDEGTGAVLGDPLRLGQIVANLVTNAVKFTPGGGLVQVSLTRSDDAAVITVTDTGIGIEAALLPRIFDRFRQADSTITRRHGGLGLGLAIVRHLAELHGGTVSAESAGAGQGARFTVGLPLAPAGGRQGQRQAALAAASVQADARLLGLRVLVVEDHHDTADLMRTVLERHGATVRVAGSLAAAVAALDGREVDVLLSDIAMPDGTGYELVRRLRAGERERGHAPIAAVAVTAFVGSDDRQRASASGFQHFASKPVEPVELVDTVARAAGRASTPRPGRTP
ncbi:MAG TPA: GAF domain-containing protein [Methylomirabilota bacterium]|nr:GAF domain-containing protein [Methylomirabilota bacterium]